METGNNKLKYIFLIIAILALSGGGYLLLSMGNHEIVSPLPKESTIRVIFITPSPTIELTPTVTPKVTGTKKVVPTTKPTAKPTVKAEEDITPTTKPSASVTSKPTVSPTVTPKVTVSPTP